MESMTVYTLIEACCEGIFSDALGCSGSSRVIGIFSTREAALTAAQEIESGVGQWETIPSERLCAKDQEVAGWEFSVDVEDGWISGRLQLHARQLDEFPRAAAGGSRGAPA